DDAPVAVVATTLDQAELLHAVDDAGSARLAYVPALREDAHGEGTLGLERNEDLDVDEAQRAAARQLAHVAHRLGRLVGDELLEDLGGCCGSVHGVTVPFAMCRSSILREAYT